MGWKTLRRILLGCCGACSKKKTKEVYGENLSDDLRDPRNQALLPKEKSGCRDAVEILDNGQVVELHYEDTDTLSAVSDFQQLEENGENSAGHSPEQLYEAEDAAMLEENRQMLWQICCDRIRADALADDKSSSDGSISDDRSLENVTPVTEISNKLAELSLQTSSEEEIAVSDDNNSGDSGDSEVSSQEPQTHLVGRKLLVANRKRKMPDELDLQDPPAQPAVDNAADLSYCTPPHLIITTAGTYENVKEDSGPQYNTEHESDSAQASSRLTKRDIPILAENEEDYWELFGALRDQLPSFLNPLGPKVTRPYDWKQDGCICQYLFPPVSTPVTVQRLDTGHRPLIINQLPSPQRAVKSYFGCRPSGLPAVQEVAPDASGDNDYDAFPQESV